jgi:disulfide oxidoreductase YuzD
MKISLSKSDNLTCSARNFEERKGKIFKAVSEEVRASRHDPNQHVTAQNILEIEVVSGEVTPEFLNAPWQKIRDALYVYPFVTITQPDAAEKVGQGRIKIKSVSKSLTVKRKR